MNNNNKVILMDTAKEFVHTLNPEEWTPGVSRNMSPFLDHLSGEGIFTHIKDFGVDATIERIAVGRAFHQDMFFHKESLKQCGQRIVQTALTNKKFLSHLQSVTHKRITKLLAVSEKIVKSKPNRKLFTEYCTAWKKLAPSLWITVILGRAFNDMLAKDLAERLAKPKEEIEEIISILTYPDEPTPFKEEELEFLELCAKIQASQNRMETLKSEATKRALKKIYGKYKVLPVNYVNEPWPLDFFQQELEQSLKNFNCKEKLDQLKQSHMKMIQKRDVLEQTLKLTGKERLEIALLRITTSLNEHRKFAYCTANYLIRPFLSKVGRAAGLDDWKDVSYLSHHEIAELIRRKNIEKNKRKIAERTHLYVFTRTKAGEFILFSGKNAAVVAQKLSQKTQEREVVIGDSLKGVIASKGNVTGRVRILLRTEDVHKVRKGDVIIAKMTSVDFLPAMRLASSFVTNEGGISCHAAIVAREMNKPCIIATGHATEFFSDGDVVEVDAVKGVVRKVPEAALVEFKEKKKAKKQPKPLHIPRMKTRKDVVCWLDSVKRSDTYLVGGKGANLGELSGKFTVPRGFCITARAYEQFLEKNRLEKRIQHLLKKINLDDTHSLEQGSKKIQKIIRAGTFTPEMKKEILSPYSSLKKKKVFVRSSATLEDMPTASFAGQHDTYHSVQGEQQVLEAVKNCFASLFTARAIYYRENDNFNHSHAKMAVVVQEMVDADFAGVIFTIDPVNKKHLIIELVRGLGEAIVSGKVTPNRYVFERTELKRLEKHETFSFKSALVKKLAMLGKEIERHFGTPQDIEFAIKKDRLYVLQSRNITTL